ncbi:hypothetical protein SAMN04515671_4379 [Nakamurella panacisegetis]|uniref:CHRD domain-containing protein n=1 Tax=Nakamurella panacisegetis TaxID=1090615 RepID=A0A1H0SZE2_9ACTN|nr:hypothetical protein [Nakamurella panacisegetis]SDP47207.1 hypothetical protein SAMN04515671_4379 [Nakamurella panacisegetis]
MRKTLLSALPIVALGVLGLGLALPAAASAAPASASYTADLQPVALSQVHGSGTFSLQLNGDQATITEKVSGLAAKFGSAAYPHVQHIHIGAKGVCPTASADTSGDGLISTTEGGPSYGAIGATLSTSGDASPAAALTLGVAPMGDTFSYSRTITLDSKTVAAVQAGTAVIVVHGLDPATLSAKVQAEKSDLVASLPLAATSPALCGSLVASQMSSTPVGSSPTGGGSTSGIQDEALLTLGGGLLLAAGGVFAARRRVARQN